MGKTTVILHLLNLSYIFLSATVASLLAIIIDILFCDLSGVFIVASLSILVSSTILGLIEVLSIPFFNSYVTHAMTFAKDKVFVYSIVLIELLVVPILLMDMSIFLLNTIYPIELLVLYILRDFIFLLIMMKL